MRCMGFPKDVRVDKEAIDEKRRDPVRPIADDGEFLSCYSSIYIKVSKNNLRVGILGPAERGRLRNNHVNLLEESRGFTGIIYANVESGVSARQAH